MDEGIKDWLAPLDFPLGLCFDSSHGFAHHVCQKSQVGDNSAVPNIPLINLMLLSSFLSILFTLNPGRNSYAYHFDGQTSAGLYTGSKALKYHIIYHIILTILSLFIIYLHYLSHIKYKTAQFHPSAHFCCKN